MEYMKVTQAAEQWGISDRRVRILCQQGKIEGVIQKGRSYLIPCDAVKPVDGRTLRHKAVSEQYLPLFSRIDSIKEQLDQRRPLTAGELQRLQEEFLIEYTYNSNAIEGNTLTLQETENMRLIMELRWQCAGFVQQSSVMSSPLCQYQV